MSDNGNWVRSSVKKDLVGKFKPSSQKMFARCAASIAVSYSFPFRAGLAALGTISCTHSFQ